MKNLWLCLIVGLAVSASTAMAQQDPFAQLRADASAAFTELDSAAAQLETQRRAEFRSQVQSEMSLLELDLIQSGMDSTRVVRIMGIFTKSMGPLLADSISNPQVLSGQFQRFIVGYRARLGLVDTTATEISDSTSGQSGVITMLIVPGPSVPVLDIFAAREAANWTKNIEDVPGNWPKRNGRTWTSEDGQVTFAVGRGQSRIVQLARNKAQVDAAVTMARRGQESGVTVAPASGVSAVRYTQSDKDGVVYCLVAIPTALLPQ